MVKFIDTEQWLINYLTERLVNVPVSSSRLTATKMVRIERTGGAALLRGTDEPTFVVEAYDGTKGKAVTLLNTVRSLLHALPRERTYQGTAIYSYDEVGGVAYLPDPLHDSPRYTVTVSLHIRTKEGVTT